MYALLLTFVAWKISPQKQYLIDISCALNLAFLSKQMKLVAFALVGDTLHFQIEK